MDLHADYSFNAFPLSETFFDRGVLVSVVFVAFLVLMILWSIKKEKLVFLGGMWFFVTLLPVCHIFPHHEIMAEHYLYLPLVGFIILLSPLLRKGTEGEKGTKAQRHRGTKAQRSRQWSKAFIVVFAVILLLFSVRTVVRNRDWKDPMTFWLKVLERTPECARAHDNLGSEYFKQKNYQKALRHYQEAVRIRPGHGIFHNNLGMAMGVTGDVEGAEAEFRKALSLDRGIAAAFNNMGIVYYQRGDYGKAASVFRYSARKKPDARAWFNCGNAEIKMGRNLEAADAFRGALRCDPDYAEAHYMLGVASEKIGMNKEAIESLQMATALKPDHAMAYYMLAEVYKKTGDSKMALWYLEKAAELKRHGKNISPRSKKGLMKR